jgi:hypothetical protein
VRLTENACLNLSTIEFIVLFDVCNQNFCAAMLLKNKNRRVGPMLQCRNTVLQNPQRDVTILQFDVAKKKKADYQPFTNRLKRGDIIARRAAYELDEVAVCSLAVAVSYLEVERFLVLTGILAKLIGHILGAPLVQVIIEGESGVLAYAIGYVYAVGAYGSAHYLNSSIGVAPYLMLLHLVTDALPKVIGPVFIVLSILHWFRLIRQILCVNRR